jgi:hypothetical protein
MRCSTDAAFDEAWLRADIYKEVLHGLVTLNSDALEKGHFAHPLEYAVLSIFESILARRREAYSRQSGCLYRLHFEKGEFVPTEERKQIADLNGLESRRYEAPENARSWP